MFKSNVGAFCISLDYELYWGVRDVLGESYYENIRSTAESIPLMLELFEKNNISATWAVVAFMLLDKSQLKEIPSVVQNLPRYENDKLDPYIDLDKIVDLHPDLISSVDNIENIKMCPKQEVASHTASHIYTLDLINKKQAFEADLKIADEIFKSKNLDVKSIVFPRNQFDNDVIKSCSEAGIHAFRDNLQHFAYEPSSGDSNTYTKRLYRLIDSYFNLSGHNTFSISNMRVTNMCLGIPASMMLRPVKNKVLDSLHLRRIKQAMKHAAINNEVFHLWWHPHNFGNSVHRNINNLDKIIAYYKTLEKEYGFSSLNMGEIEKVYKGEYER